MAASIQNPFGEPCEGLRRSAFRGLRPAGSAHGPRGPCPYLRACEESYESGSRETMSLNRPLAGRQPGFGQLAYDLGRRRHELGASRRLHGATGRFAVGLEALPRRGVHERDRAPAGRGATALGARRRWLVAPCPAPQRWTRRRGRWPVWLSALRVALAAEPSFRRGLRAPFATPAALRAAARRGLERWGRVRGRLASTPTSLRGEPVESSLVLASITPTSLLKGRRGNIEGDRKLIGDRCDRPRRRVSMGSWKRSSAL